MVSDLSDFDEDAVIGKPMLAERAQPEDWMVTRKPVPSAMRSVSGLWPGGQNPVMTQLLKWHKVCLSSAGAFSFPLLPPA